MTSWLYVKGIRGCPDAQFISGKMRLCEPWKSQSPAEFENAMEAMEKLVMNRLYN
jgi:hypothetical protein